MCLIVEFEYLCRFESLFGDGRTPEQGKKNPNYAQFLKELFGRRIGEEGDGVRKHRRLEPVRGELTVSGQDARFSAALIV